MSAKPTDSDDVRRTYLNYSLFTINSSLERSEIFGDERISTGILNCDKRVVESDHYKTDGLSKINDKNEKVLLAA